MNKKYFNNLMEFLKTRKVIKFEEVKQTKCFEFWDADFDDFKIIINADSHKEAVKILENYLLDLRTKPVRFSINKEEAEKNDE